MIYRVVVDGQNFYDETLDRVLINPTVEAELNSAGSFDCTIPPNHDYYSLMKLLTSDVEVYEDDDLIFYGRPIEITTDFYNQKTVHCEGALAFFNDSILRPAEYENVSIKDIFRYIVQSHNSQVPANRQFTIGRIEVADKLVYRKFDYETCKDGLAKFCLDTTGGYLITRRVNGENYIDWIRDLDSNPSDQPVQYALNITDISQKLDGADIKTGIIPLGPEDELGVKLNIQNCSRAAGADRILSEAASTYGAILQVVDFDDVTTADELYDKGLEWLEDDQFEGLSIEVNAADLAYLDERFHHFELGQMVHCVSDPHLIDKNFPITRISIALDSAVKNLTIGTQKKQTFTEIYKDGSTSSYTSYNGAGGSTSSASNSGLPTTSLSGSAGGGGGSYDDTELRGLIGTNRTNITNLTTAMNSKVSVLAGTGKPTRGIGNENDIYIRYDKESTGTGLTWKADPAWVMTTPQEMGSVGGRGFSKVGDTEAIGFMIKGYDNRYGGPALISTSSDIDYTPPTGVAKYGPILYEGFNWYITQESYWMIADPIPATGVQVLDVSNISTSDQNQYLLDLLELVYEKAHVETDAPKIIAKYIKRDGEWIDFDQNVKDTEEENDEDDLFSFFDTIVINSQYASGSLTDHNFQFNINDYANNWSTFVVAHNSVPIDITKFKRLEFTIGVSEQADYGTFWVNLSQNKYTWATNSWPGFYNDTDALIKVTESGTYFVDVSDLSGSYYIYIGVTTGKASTVRSYGCDNGLNGKMVGAVTEFKGSSADTTTEIVANPVGTPTDTLNTVEIGGTIYEIVGGNGNGSDSGYTATPLYDGTPTMGPVQLDESVLNFDAIYIEAKANNELLLSNIVLKDTLEDGLGSQYIGLVFWPSSYHLGLTPASSDTSFVLYGGGGINGVTKIYGLNYGSSGCSGSSYKRDELFKTSGYADFGDIQLSDDISKYDDIEIILSFDASSDRGMTPMRVSSEFILDNCEYVNSVNTDNHLLPELWANSGFSLAYDSTNRKLKCWGRNGAAGVYAVYGIKYGGSNNVFISQDDYDALPNSKESDNVAYFIHNDTSSDYTYHTDNTDKIVVRVYHEGESDEETEVFFCGWNQTAGDVPIPQEIAQYLPADTVSHIYHSGNFPSGGLVQDGWIGFYNGNIRMWNQPRSAVTTGTVYGVVKTSDPNISEPQSNIYSDPYDVGVSAKIVMNGITFCSNK